MKCVRDAICQIGLTKESLRQTECAANTRCSNIDTGSNCTRMVPQAGMGCPTTGREAVAPHGQRSHRGHHIVSDGTKSEMQECTDCPATQPEVVAARRRRIESRRQTLQAGAPTHRVRRLQKSKCRQVQTARQLGPRRLLHAGKGFKGTPDIAGWPATFRQICKVLY